MTTLTGPQEAALRSHMASIGAAGFIASRDEEHDEHVFIDLFRDRESLGEVILEGDGTFDL